MRLRILRASPKPAPRLGRNALALQIDGEKRRHRGFFLPFEFASELCKYFRHPATFIYSRQPINGITISRALGNDCAKICFAKSRRSGPLLPRAKNLLSRLGSQSKTGLT